MYLLQAAEVVKAASPLIDYGLLGIFAILMIIVITYMEKQRSSVITDMKETIKMLGSKIDAQQKEQEAQQEKHVEFITTEYKQSMEINRRCLEVLDEVKEVLKQRYLKS